LWDEAYINEKGDVYSCCHARPGVIGNIHHSSLREIHNSEQVQRFREESLAGRLGCFARCTLLKKDEIEPVAKPLNADFSELRRVKIMFGEGCNINCVMCPQNSRSRDYLDFDVLVRNVDLTHFELIELQGGEPLFIEPAKRYFDYAAAHGKKISFLTNGILVNDEWAEKISLHSTFVYFSLNAATRETHEAINRGSHWERVIANIQRVRAARERTGSGVRILGHMTIIPENLGEIPHFIQRHAELGFDAVDFGYDLGVPAHLRSIRNLLLKRKLRREIRETIDRLPDPASVETHRLELLGLV
jgi:MoaA/NifB/PqqE/SkfB family radical SAM enzyme